MANVSEVINVLDIKVYKRLSCILNLIYLNPMRGLRQ